MPRTAPRPLASLTGTALLAASLAFGALSSCVSDGDKADTTPIVTETADTADPASSAVAFVIDTSNARALYLRLDTREILHEIRLDTLHPTLCGDATCADFGGWPTVNPETGLDEVLLVFTPNGEGGSGPIVEKVRITPDGDEVVWTMDSLDFMVNFADRPELCDQKVPCAVPETADTDASRRCRLGLPHEVEVTEEGPNLIRMWIADTESPSRAISVRLDPTSTCGVVDDVVSADTALEWGALDAINDVEVVSLDGGEQALLLNSLSETGDGGHASVSFWRKVAGSWTRAWRLPDPSSGGFLAAAHNADWITDVDGQPYVVYAHSNGQGAHGLVEGFTGAADHRGSVGVARVDADRADYLFDAVVPGGFGFVRDANLLRDGSFLVLDSGCMSPEDTDCTNVPGLWQVSLPSLADAEITGLSGAFSPDRENQLVLAAEPLSTLFTPPLNCGLSTPYAAHIVLASALGTTLRARLDDPEGSCDGAPPRTPPQ